MFNFLKKQSIVIPAQVEISPSSSSLRGSKGRGNLPPQIESLTLHLSGLHCTSCATNIDLTLEDLPSVKSNTNYAKQETKLEFDPSKTSLKEIKATITDLGYKITKIS